MFDEDRCEELRGDSEPIVEQGWCFISEPFSATRPNSMPVFSEVSGISVHVVQFTLRYPRYAFCNLLAMKLYTNFAME